MAALKWKFHFEANSKLVIPGVKSGEFYGVTLLLIARKSKTINVFPT